MKRNSVYSLLFMVCLLLTAIVCFSSCSKGADEPCRDYKVKQLSSGNTFIFVEMDSLYDIGDTIYRNINFVDNPYITVKEADKKFVIVDTRVH